MKVIYCIRNLVTDEIYIGGTVNFYNRRKEHRTKLRSGINNSHLLQKAWNLYGEINFAFEIIEYLNESDDKLKREQFWMDFFKPEYNISKYAHSSMLGRKMSADSRLKMTQSRIGLKRKVPLTEEQKLMFSKAADSQKKKIIQMDADKKELLVFSSITEAAKNIKGTKAAIALAAKRGNRSFGYYWKYA